MRNRNKEAVIALPNRKISLNSPLEKVSSISKATLDANVIHNKPIITCLNKSSNGPSKTDIVRSKSINKRISKNQDFKEANFKRKPRDLKNKSSSDPQKLSNRNLNAITNKNEHCISGNLISNTVQSGGKDSCNSGKIKLFKNRFLVFPKLSSGETQVNSSFDLKRSQSMRFHCKKSVLEGPLPTCGSLTCLQKDLTDNEICSKHSCFPYDRQPSRSQENVLDPRRSSLNDLDLNVYRAVKELNVRKQQENMPTNIPIPSINVGAEYIGMNQKNNLAVRANTAAPKSVQSSSEERILENKNIKKQTLIPVSLRIKQIDVNDSNFANSPCPSRIQSVSKRKKSENEADYPVTPNKKQSLKGKNPTLENSNITCSKTPNLSADSVKNKQSPVIDTNKKGSKCSAENDSFNVALAHSGLNVKEQTISDFKTGRTNILKKTPNKILDHAKTRVSSRCCEGTKEYAVIGNVIKSSIKEKVRKKSKICDDSKDEIHHKNVENQSNANQSKKKDRTLSHQNENNVDLSQDMNDKHQNIESLSIRCHHSDILDTKFRLLTETLPRNTLNIFSACPFETDDYWINYVNSSELFTHFPKEVFTDHTSFADKKSHVEFPFISIWNNIGTIYSLAHIRQNYVNLCADSIRQYDLPIETNIWNEERNANLNYKQIFSARKEGIVRSYAFKLWLSLCTTSSYYYGFNETRHITRLWPSVTVNNIDLGGMDNSEWILFNSTIRRNGGLENVGVRSATPFSPSRCNLDKHIPSLLELVSLDRSFEDSEEVCNHVMSGFDGCKKVNNSSFLREKCLDFNVPYPVEIVLEEFTSSITDQQKLIDGNFASSCNGSDGVSLARTDARIITTPDSSDVNTNSRSTNCNSLKNNPCNQTLMPDCQKTKSQSGIVISNTENVISESQIIHQNSLIKLSNQEVEDSPSIKPSVNDPSIFSVERIIVNDQNDVSSLVDGGEKRIVSSTSTSNVRRSNTKSKPDVIESKAARSVKSSTNKPKVQDPVKVLRPALTPGQQTSASQNQKPNFGTQPKTFQNDPKCRLQQKSLIAKDETQDATRKIEALTVLVHYLTNEYEGFTTKKLKAEVKVLTTQLTDLRLSLDESTATVRRYEHELSDQTKKHLEQLDETQKVHEDELLSLKKSHEEELCSIMKRHRDDCDDLLTQEALKLAELSEAHQSETSQTENLWRSRLDDLSQQHKNALEETQVKFAEQLKDVELSWKNKERALLDENSLLVKQQDVLKQETKALEVSLLSDKDHRLQAAKKVCISLQNEVDSLKAVLEMRNTEIHKLRDQIVDKDRLHDELDGARVKVRSLQAKAEDLQAQLEQKHSYERQLLADHHSLSESVQKEVATNKRLTLENEELQWKLRQKDTSQASLSSTSPKISSDAVCESSNTPSATSCEATGTMDNSTTKNKDLALGCCKTDFTISPEADRSSLRDVSSPKLCLQNKRINCKRGDSKWSQSFTNIPEDITGSPKRSKDFWGEDIGMESPPLSPRVKGVVEKSSSVSFILDLNATYPEDTFLTSGSPYRDSRNQKTGNLRRTSLAKSVSGDMKKESPKKPLVRGTSTPMTFQTTIVDGKIRTKAVPYADVHRLEKSNCGIASNSSEENMVKMPIPTTSHRNRSFSTSESSDGGDLERISPTGLSWTVPLHSSSPKKSFSKHIPSSFHVVPDLPRHFQLTDEDEYDENENEFVEVLTLNEEMNSASLKTILNPTPSISLSLSDSDISQCGSRIDLTTEDDSSDQEDGGLPPNDISQTPKEGAGEAMVLPDPSYCLASNGKAGEASNISSDSEDPNRESPLKNERGESSMSWSEDPDFDLTSSSEAQDVF